MKITEREAIGYFIGKYRKPPERDDGTIDYECLCGEFLVEGESPEIVMAHYAALPSEYKRPIINRP